ncbi:MAG: endolytic transglycosylase MltG [candidate division WOR-3 bacterium]|nr:endolytic transglycosylase MltG [candidate division WOR-3 bacterium]MCX7837462.1 endolytic transglycosylase MltG [candidate division WOR-3 bacterium]MDW8114039.1 endolytic transglycosylase MltG [candidate division WOR-3 bacterium]
MKERIKKFEKIFLILFAFLFIFFHQFFIEEEVNEKIKIFIPKNLTLKEIGGLLKEKGVIKRKWLFFLYTTIFLKRKLIKCGYYQIPKNHKEFKVFLLLLRKQYIPVFITIPEGLTLKEVAEILEKKGICPKEEFIKYATSPDVLRKYNIFFPSAEGFLFPDSYQFFTNSLPEVVFDKMCKRFWQIYLDLKRKYKTNLSDSTIIILASIVEEEAKVDNERPIIASVFLNRLKKNMPLQSCATIEYLLEKRKKVLSKEDLKINSPYNTYLYKGLPPTPICNPSKKSLEAVLNPKKTDYYYFFTKDGITHIFSKTYKEHLEKLKH